MTCWGRESKGIVGGEGRRELEVAKGRRMVTKGRMVEQGPVGSRRGRGRCDLGRERGVVDTIEFRGWKERRRVNDPFKNTSGAFFGIILNVPSIFLIGTSVTTR